MTNADRQYATDPAFKMMVDSIHAVLHDNQFTPGEVRQAAVLACCRFEQESPFWTGRSGLRRPNSPPVQNMDPVRLHAALTHALENLFLAERKEAQGDVSDADDCRAAAVRGVRNAIEATGLAVVNRQELIELIALRDKEKQGRE